ncbi:hypothetical protein [Bacteriophage sp.]|nr:hypothetical protein [Bacteriophage sp.]
MIADKDLFLTLDGKVVGESDPLANFLLARKGQKVSAADVAKYGLEPKAKAETKAPETKAVTIPPETKRVSGPQGKK